MRRPYSGYLISLEGIDGSGKTSLAKALAQHLGTKGLSIFLTKEPGGTHLGQALRSLLQTQKQEVCGRAEFLLFAADRAQHFQEIIIPALHAGTIVIADRLADSSLAYQGYGRKLGVPALASINEWAMQGITPDLTIYLRIDPEQAWARIQARNEKLTTFEQESYDFWQRVIKGYEEIFSKRANVVTINAMQNIEKVCQQALQEILKGIA